MVDEGLVLKSGDGDGGALLGDEDAVEAGRCLDRDAIRDAVALRTAEDRTPARSTVVFLGCRLRMASLPSAST
jgi:hypothetical protein